ncbi:hypothetical protein FHETE_9124 [Fusarium heterosporum]|uniref:Uncharacterized protein n=1 Tax=Fusarium heterosporum TaxID=42747 RepID=A0A8H5WHG4_FUSHE|nr:hypothetical protein FHETE_9124 [Fusarium heterosporum]
MAQPQRLTGPHLQTVLGDVVAALAIYQNRRDLSDLLATKLKGPGYGDLSLTREQQEVFEDSMNAHSLISLAYAGYVHSWERYRRVFNLDPTAYAEGSTIFGLAQYGGPGGRAQFELDYPEAIVDVWNNSNAVYWFANTIRNALAHGSYYFTTWSVKVTLYNVHPQTGRKTFDVSFPAAVFARLILRSLQSFVRNVGPVGGHAPLSQMLEYLQ